VSASLQQLYAFAEKRRRNLPMRTMTIVHFGQKACAWGGATSVATSRRNEVFYLQLPPHQGGTGYPEPPVLWSGLSWKIEHHGSLQGKSIYLLKEELISNKR
jgi:hypothetical protein